MIITVTMNPAIDKTVEIDHFCPGKLNRIGYPVTDAGGKGINVSKALKKLGETSIATGFLGKEGSDIILDALSAEQIQTDFISCEGVTRTNFKLMELDGTLTELNEPGMTVAREKVEKLLEKIEQYATKDVWFVLSGSIPEDVDVDIYARIITKVHQKGAKVFVDADGRALIEAIKAVPDMIKPNEAELAEYFGIRRELSQEEILQLTKRLSDTGIETIVVSQGSRGAVFADASEEKLVYQNALAVEVHSTVGAGDAMAAALVYAKEKQLPMQKMVQLAMAVSAGAVATAGTNPPDRETIEAILQEFYG